MLILSNTKKCFNSRKRQASGKSWKKEEQTNNLLLRLRHRKCPAVKNPRISRIGLRNTRAWNFLQIRELQRLSVLYIKSWIQVLQWRWRVKRREEGKNSLSLTNLVYYYSLYESTCKNEFWKFYCSAYFATL